MITIKNTNPTPTSFTLDGVEITMKPDTRMPVNEVHLSKLPSGIVVVSEKILTEIDPYNTDGVSEGNDDNRQLLNESN